MQDGFVSHLIEKPEHPTSNLAIVGLYWIRNTKLLNECVDELIVKDIRTRGEYQLTDALGMMVKRGEQLKTFNVEGWFDCGKPETLLATNRHLLEKRPKAVPMDGVVIVPPVYISPKAKITNSVIGPYATIASGAVVAESIVRNSIVGEDAQVDASLLEGSIVGIKAVVRGSFNRINIGARSQ